LIFSRTPYTPFLELPQHHGPVMKGGQPANLRKVREFFEKHNVRFEEFTSGQWYQLG
jgi:hypothetical protein